MTTGTAITIRHSDDIPIKYLGMKYEMKRPYDSALRLMRASKPNLESAKCLLEVASNAGDHRATYALATWYLHGKSPVVSIDKKKAANLLKTSADAGNVDASFDYGVSLEKGAGVRKNEKAALVYYLRAALGGDAAAMEAVGRMYYFGIGVPKDRKVAWVWLDRHRKLASGKSRRKRDALDQPAEPEPGKTKNRRLG